MRAGRGEEKGGEEGWKDTTEKQTGGETEKRTEKDGEKQPEPNLLVEPKRNRSDRRWETLAVGREGIRMQTLLLLLTRPPSSSSPFSSLQALRCCFGSASQRARVPV